MVDNAKPLSIQSIIRMALSSPKLPNRYAVYERVALALTTGLVGIGLLSKLISLDWLFDSLYWLAGAFVVYSARHSRRETAQPAATLPRVHRLALLVCLYLFVDSVLLATMLLPYEGLLGFMYLILSGLYGAALRERCHGRGLFLGHFPWQSLFQPPTLWLTLSILLPLVCMYQPMLSVYQSFQAWSGPIVWTLPGSQYMNAGKVIELGSMVTVRGYQVALGHGVALLLVGAAFLLLAYQAGLVSAGLTVRLLRISGVLIVLWWLLVAKGYQSLANPANLCFIFGCGLWLTRLFVAPSTGLTAPPPHTDETTGA